jgi:hypothetical protein
MSNVKPNRSQKDAQFLRRFDALTGATDEREKSAVDEDLLECGVDPNQLRKVAYDRIRNIATQKYLSLGKDCPPQMQEALRQLRPPTPEEEEQNKRTQAASLVQGLLSSIKAGISSVLPNSTPAGATFAPAFRNKHEELTEKDRDLLNSQQSELDSGSDEKRGGND